jgi:protein-L-isoaspartate(D-aspartate) O-methyltransferase
MHAYALEMLHEQLQSGNKALDVGAGSGYLVACIAHMVGPDGQVVGIEYVGELARHAKERLQSDPNETIRKMMDSGRIEIIHGDGWKGYEAKAPYDAIHVGAGTVIFFCKSYILSC